MNCEIDIAYRRRMNVWKALLAIAFLWFLADKVSAQAPPYIVQHNSVQAFSANCLQHADQSPVYNFLDSCAPPVNPPNDPNALNVLVGKFATHACGNFTNTNGQDFSRTFGIGDGTIPPPGQYGPPQYIWPFWPSTSVMIPLPPRGRYYGGVLTSGPNPGVLPHYLKLNGYAGSCVPPLQTPSTARFNVCVVAVGTTAPPTGLCAMSNVAPDNRPLVQLKFAGPVNSAHCLGVIGGQYRYIVENAGATNVTTLLTWN